MRVNRIVAVAAVALAGLLASVGLAQSGDAVKVPAAQLYKEVSKSAKKANEKYKGKTIEITGKVARVTRSFTGKPEVAVEAGNEFTTVLCYTADKEPWGAFAKGQTVKVTGKFPDFPVVASLEDCKVEAVSAAPLKAVTAAALAKEAEADPVGSGKKLDKTTLKVTGTVVSQEFNAKTNFTDVVLKGTGKTNVACRLIPAEKEAAAALKAGQTATIVGQFGGAYENQVHLMTAMVLTEKK